MKLITFAVPCYNSAEYMHRCIDSLLVCGDDCEIIIVNDGSKDNTSEIAHQYEKKYPFIKVCDKENGGHGSGVNKGLELAQGLYYKVVDSDDWLNKSALIKLLAVLKKDYENNQLKDLYIANYVYEKLSEGTRYERKTTKNMPVNKEFTWRDVRPFHTSSVMIMHSLWFKTEILKKSNVHLPEHTFYVDNIFSYIPLPFVKSMFYLDVDMYGYFIGREDQSVSEVNIVKRYDQQIRVMNKMLYAYSYTDMKKFPKQLRKYMLHDLSVLMMLTLMFTAGGKDDINTRKLALKKLWLDLKSKDRKMYNYLRFRSYPALVCYLPYKLMGSVLVKGYCYYRKKLKCS